MVGKIMESKKTKYISHSVIVYPEDIKYFDEFLRKNFQKIRYEILCEDETKLKPANLNEILEYENPDFKKIASITFEASNEKNDNDSVEIVIGKAGLSFLSSDTAMIHFYFSDIKRQIPVEDEIMKRIRAMRPWYFWLIKIPFSFIFPFLLWGYSISLSAISLIKKLTGIIPLTPSTPPTPSGFTEGEVSILVLATMGILFLVGFLIDNSRDYLFPKYFFYIGRQQKNYDKKRIIVNIIFGVIILGIIINLVSTIIASVLKL
jgi:hypothetical protein